MEKTVFITGAAGFIGFHLALFLNEKGIKVVGYDNFNDYYTPTLKRLRQQQLKEAGISVIEGDVCDLATMTQLVKDHGITHVVHLAAQAGVRYSLQNPQAYVKANLEGFVQILELCRLEHLKLVYASSSSVYGLNTKVPFSEDDRTDQQASLYGVTKKSNELMAATYNHLYGLSSVGLRFFTVYGPWGRPDMAYFSFAEAIIEKKPIPVFNEGRMQRDFTYVTDIVKGIVAAMERPSGCEIFNLGNHRPEELLTLIRLIEEGLGERATLDFKPMQAGDVTVTYADISRSRQLLGFEPSTPLSEGIPLFLNWFKDYRAQRASKS